MNKITVWPSKTLKLTNVLKAECDIEKEDFNLEVLVNRMHSYIRAKGAMQVGPLIQYTNACLDEQGQIKIQMSMLMQCNTFLHRLESPYSMESVIRIPNCMYCRYQGPEEKLKFAYDKLQVEAFEQEIPLKGSSYTIFVDRNEEEETIVADVFMEKTDGR